MTNAPVPSWFPAQVTKKSAVVVDQMATAEVDKAKAMAKRCRESSYKKCD
jgi:hypothetical protein